MPGARRAALAAALLPLSRGQRSWALVGAAIAQPWLLAVSCAYGDDGAPQRTTVQGSISGMLAAVR